MQTKKENKLQWTGPDLNPELLELQEQLLSTSPLRVKSLTNAPIYFASVNISLNNRLHSVKKVESYVQRIG